MTPATKSTAISVQQQPTQSRDCSKCGAPGLFDRQVLTLLDLEPSERGEAVICPPSEQGDGRNQHRREP